MRRRAWSRRCTVCTVLHQQQLRRASKLEAAQHRCREAKKVVEAEMEVTEVTEVAEVAEVEAEDDTEDSEARQADGFGFGRFFGVF